jgi:hypothetical protein
MRHRTNSHAAHETSTFRKAFVLLQVPQHPARQSLTNGLLGLIVPRGKHKVSMHEQHRLIRASVCTLFHMIRSSLRGKHWISHFLSTLVVYHPNIHVSLSSIT